MRNSSFHYLTFATVFLFIAGNQLFAQKLERTPKNVVLMIGDGMGLAQVHALKMVSNQPVHILQTQHIGLMSTHSFDNEVTDSGAGGTAIATGYKTRNGMIGMKPDSTEIPSMLDIFGKYGMSTGIVVSCAVTHATPASFVAKEVSRNHYEAIAQDFLFSPVDVVIGGGIKHFNKRKDARNLTDEMVAKGYTYMNELPDGLSADWKKLLILTDSVHPEKIQEGRGDLLPSGTLLALNQLSKNPNGFFLMVEGSQIDWAGHANDSSYLIAEMKDFDQTVGVVLEFLQQHPETLVIVTADHETGGLTFPHGAIKGSQRFAYSTGDHTGIMVPVYVFGAGAEAFVGQYDNTDLIRKIMQLKGLEF